MDMRDCAGCCWSPGQTIPSKNKSKTWSAIPPSRHLTKEREGASFWTGSSRFPVFFACLLVNFFRIHHGQSGTFGRTMTRTHSNRMISSTALLLWSLCWWSQPSSTCGQTSYRNFCQTGSDIIELARDPETGLYVSLPPPDRRDLVSNERLNPLETTGNGRNDDHHGSESLLLQLPHFIRTSSKQSSLSIPVDPHRSLQQQEGETGTNETDVTASWPRFRLRSCPCAPSNLVTDVFCPAEFSVCAIPYSEYHHDHQYLLPVVWNLYSFCISHMHVYSLSLSHTHTFNTHYAFLLGYSFCRIILVLQPKMK